MDKKWTMGLGLLGILIVFLLLWNFAPAIQRWLASVFVDIILLLAAFAAGGPPATLAERYDFSGGQIENIARKRTVEMILRGVEPTMEELDEFCRNEQLGNRAKRRRIGF